MSKLEFDGRVAIVTGAGSGLGRAHALLLASRGAAVVVNDISTAAGESVVQEIVAKGGRAVADGHSVATPEGGASLVHAAVDAFGTVDIVVNNAGIVRDKTFAKMDSTMFADVLGVHLNGAFNVTQPAYEIMRDRKYGRIVSTSSAAGLFGNFGQTNYGAAKMGLVGFTRVIALEGAKYGIKANVVAPIAATAMSAGLLDEDWERRLKPELVSPAVAWLAHESCPVSGEILSAAAGRVARVFVAETKGFYTPDLTLEDVRDQWARICDESGYGVPESAEGERNMLAAAFAEEESIKQ
ncbi:SDR family NAD(P)-dependent oxidoreductase [Rhodococcus qingshengii]|uniref:SDR family NAD(P)-dependent oxidoreductase n=1 Tax=Rhodococcus qingshengii TaxID=334542 RepID=UPI001E5CDF17|nr:SDR family NAD(P)-dependent oxidoreductase [Rhodococcus qingshengii]MCQ4150595.1 SDR family NAD(P)-dependent oxidoreductase [Rhodococcus qingshengii]UGQ55417.1 SDR family NAD(P)-dependent oxidoreductase [Rhodococcus qingshengii]